MAGPHEAEPNATLRKGAMQKIAMTRKELEVFAMQSLGFDKASLRRMSTLFLAQLLQMKLRGDHSVNAMAREVHSLENNAGLHHLFRKNTGPATKAREWIVFKTYNGIKYYFTTASLGEGDQRINRRVMDAYRFDFPFLQAPV